MEQTAFRSLVGVGICLFLHLSACLDFGLDTTTSATSPDTSFTEYIPDTSLSIDPTYFLGDVPCNSNGGTLKSYVATVTDITSSGPSVILASSSPTSCSRKIVFEYISPKHTYTVDIDGYEQTPEELTPYLGPGSGARLMVPTSIYTQAQDPSSGLILSYDQVVPPRWKTDCESVIAAVDKRVGFFDCTPLQDLGTPPPTSIQVNPNAALGQNRCLSEGGQVAGFSIEPLDAALPPVNGVNCPGQTVTYNAGIQAGQTYRFRIHGYKEGEIDPHWSSECFATAAEGQEVKAACDPLNDKGGILIDPAKWLTGQTYTCGSSVSYYIASVDEAKLSSGPIDCDKSVMLGPFSPGGYNVRLTLYGEKGGPAFDTLCTAGVTIGNTAELTCPPIP